LKRYEQETTDPKVGKRMSEAALGEASKGLCLLSLFGQRKHAKDKKINSSERGDVCWMGWPEVLLIDPADGCRVYFRAKTRQVPPPNCRRNTMQDTGWWEREVGSQLLVAVK
jgi:hypothetical protein